MELQIEKQKWKVNPAKRSLLPLLYTYYIRKHFVMYTVFIDILYSARIAIINMIINWNKIFHTCIRRSRLSQINNVWLTICDER